MPETFWRKFYNIGGGSSMRVVNHEFAGLMAKALGAGDAWGNYLPNWFATRNFHGQWYADSDRLEELVPFRSETMKDFVSQTSATVPSYVRLFSKWLPGAGRKRMERLAREPGGTLNWIESDDRAHINAYFGSREAWEALPSSWAEFEPRQPSRDVSLLHHGYDTEKPAENWSRTELEEAAEFRGAQFLSDSAPEPDLPISWQCALGHQFSITPRLLLSGGHWCPTCMTDPDSYDRNAKLNPFFAQVWPDSD